MVPVSNVNCGVPETLTVWLNLIATGMVAPIVYPLLALVELTETTVGTLPSITMALLAPNEPEAPGDGNVKFAALPAASTMVPLFNSNALVDV